MAAESRFTPGFHPKDPLEHPEGLYNYPGTLSNTLVVRYQIAPASSFPVMYVSSEYSGCSRTSDGHPAPPVEKAIAEFHIQGVPKISHWQQYPSNRLVI